MDALAEAIRLPFREWWHQCHAVSLAIVRSGLVEGRVARGWCRGVGGQHSWIVRGPDCYAAGAEIVDPTLWSYDSTVEGVWRGFAKQGRHRPHGAGSIWGYGKPPEPKGGVLKLAVEDRLSPGARAFLEVCGPLDSRGWRTLANSPVLGWPAKEIVEAMLDTPGMEEWVPIDVVGMLTDRNPAGLYLRTAGE